MSNRESFRELSKRYAHEIALNGVCREREELFRDINDLKVVRPPVLIFEVPWGELKLPELEFNPDTEYAEYECSMRRSLFQWKHFQGDHAYPPYFNVYAKINDSGNGIVRKFSKGISHGTGTHTTSHRIEDQFPDIEALEKLHLPEISYNKEATEREAELLSKLSGDVLPVKITGKYTYFVPWDNIAYTHGPDNILYDLYDRPEFMHAFVKKLVDIEEYQISQLEKLGLYETENYYIHCTPGLIRGTRHKEIGEGFISAGETWLRCAAQIFAVVSPEMRDEFDLEYIKRISKRFKYTYYGCCEPLSGQVKTISEKLGTLRRITCTPWADVEQMAEEIGGDFVLSLKANPAYVAGKSFEPEPVIREISRACEACLKNGTPMEIVLKDVSTLSCNYTNLEKWLGTVNSVLDKYY